MLTVGFRSGALASLIATFAAAPGSRDHAIRLFGTTGTLETSLRGGTRERPERLHAILRNRVAHTGPRELSLPTSDGRVTIFERMWDDYAHAIQTTRRRSSAPRTAAKSRILRAAYQAIADGQTVTL